MAASDFLIAHTAEMRVLPLRSTLATENSVIPVSPGCAVGITCMLKLARSGDGFVQSYSVTAHSFAPVKVTARFVAGAGAGAGADCDRLDTGGPSSSLGGAEGGESLHAIRATIDVQRRNTATRRTCDLRTLFFTMETDLDEDG
jgi:hypothetical protein